jgi:hypothetical protein
VTPPLRGALALLLLASAPALLSCRRVPGTEPAGFERATVESLSLRFLSETDAELSGELRIEPTGSGVGRVQQLQWELWLDGRWFAAGTQALAVPIEADEPATVPFEARLHHRALVLSSRPATVQLGFRGALLAVYGDELQRLPFARQLELELDRAPQLDAPVGE